MREPTIARIYAETLLRLATTGNAVDAVDDSVAALGESLQEDAQFARFLSAPHIAAEEKRAVIERTLAGKIHPALLRFLYLVVDKRREPLLGEMVVAWRQLLDERANRMAASVMTAAPLDDATRDGMQAALERATGKKIVLETKIDPAMIGGVVVRYGDSVIDGSVRSRLAAIRNRLRRAHVRSGMA